MDKAHTAPSPMMREPKERPAGDRGERGGFRGDRPERSERPAADTPAA